MKIKDVIPKELFTAPLGLRDVHTLRQVLHAAYGAGRGNNTDARAQLDAIAAPYLKNADKNNFPQEDYLVLRLAGDVCAQAAEQDAREKMISDEENFIVQTASQVLGARVLEIYLSRIGKRYRALLQSYRLHAREIERREKALCFRAVRACLAGLCSRRKWALCLGVLRHYKEHLGEGIFHVYATAVRAGFAQEKGEEAWRATDERLPLNERKAGALALLKEETDSELKDLAQAHVHTLFERAEAELSRAQSGVYALLAEGKPADVTLLASAEIPLALAAAARAAHDAQTPAPDVFNRLYFQDDRREIKKAYDARQISARDYLRLIGLSYARKGGFSDENTYALAQALVLFLAKNNVPAAAADEAVCTVLHMPQEMQYERAQELKKIYLLQEFSK